MTDAPRRAFAQAPFDQYRGVSVVVVGASGFIGRWVARLLTECEAELTLCVRAPDRARKIFSDYKVGGRIVSLNLIDRQCVREVLIRSQPAIVFNLAGYGVDRSETDASAFHEINTAVVGELCRTMAEIAGHIWPGQRLVHVGSALEYGKTSGNLSESSATNPTTPYGRSKLQGTLQLAAGCRSLSVKGLTARVFTAYGPGEHRGRLLPSLLEAAGTGAPVPLSHGLQKRDFIFVEDVAEGLLRLGLSDAEHGEVVNLATGTLTSVRTFVEQAAEVLGIPSNRLLFDALPARTEEMEHLPVMVERLHALTRWTAPTDIRAGILQTRNFMHALCTR
jgi:dTDP-6-deoxy-L-talose 4-dehydrogenase [NAD(P)+]